jgi:hypothetical protein
MKSLLYCAAIGLSVLPLVAVAQDSQAVAQDSQAVAQDSQTMVIAAQDPNAIILPAGTNVRIRLLSNLTSQDNKSGQQFDIEVAEDVMLNGRAVIGRGSPGVGELTLVKKKGMWGKSGKLEGRFISVRSNGRDIPLRGNLADKGNAGTAGVVGAIVVLPIAGFFVTGTSAEILSGTSFQAKTDSDIPLTFAP